MEDFLNNVDIPKLSEYQAKLCEEAVVRRCSVKKVFLEILQSSQENTCGRASFLIKKETLAQVFSYEFCEISKNTFFTEHFWATASKHLELKFSTELAFSFHKGVNKQILCFTLLPDIIIMFYSIIR